MTDLKNMPVRKWQCSEGCIHLVRRTGRNRNADCHFWINFFKDQEPTLSGNPIISKPCGFIPAKRLVGPFTDQPALLCPHFKKKGGDA